MELKGALHAGRPFFMREMPHSGGVAWAYFILQFLTKILGSNFKLIV